MAQTRANDTGARNGWREKVSQGLRDSATHRKCPSCGRKGAIRRETDGDLVLRTCRYCDFEKAHYRETVSP